MDCIELLSEYLTNDVNNVKALFRRA